MSLNLVLGGRGSGKTYYLCKKMIDEISNGDKKYIYIVPEQFTLETQKKLVNMRYELQGLAGIMNVDIVSFNRLAFRIFEELGIDKLSIIDDMGKLLILRKVIEENKDKLVIYKDKANMTGFIEEIKSVISELYQFGINISDIDEIIEKLNGQNVTKTKLKEIVFIYDAFKKAIMSMTESDSSTYITKEEVLSELMKVIPESDIIKDSYIVLDGYTGFTPVQLKLISSLLEYSKGVTVAITIRPEDINLTSTGCVGVTEQELFKMSKDTINSLYAIANDKRIKIESPVIIDDSYKDNNGKSDLRFLDKNVFKYIKNTYKEKPDNIRIYKATNPSKEAKVITDNICKLMKKDETLRYRDIAVITGDESSMMVIDRYMNMAEIPHFVDSKKNIMGNPFVECIRAILEMIDRDFKYESVFRYLRTYLTDIDISDIDKFDNYVLEMGIKGRKKYITDFVRTSRSVDEEELKNINKIRETFIKPINELYENIKGKNVKGITEGILKFVIGMGFEKKAEDYSKIFEETKDMDKKSEYGQIMKKIYELFKKIMILLGDEKIKLAEYRKILDTGFSEIKVGVVPMAVDRVIVGDIERTRLSEIKVLFIMGANDGNIPKHSSKGGLLSQNDRTVLKDLNVTLSKTPRESAFDQKFYMYLFLTKPTEKLFITYSETGADGSSIRPSYIIDSILDIYELSDELCRKNETHMHEVSNNSTVFEYLLTKLREYGEKEFDDELKEILSYYSEKSEYRERLIKGINGAFFTNRVNSIDNLAARAVYGDGKIAATRLEKYAACAYAHFLEYGLRLMERRVFEIQVGDIGTIYHKCIELFTKELKKKESLDDIDDDMRKDMIHRCMEEVSEKFARDIFSDSKRNSFILSKCEKVADKTAWAIIEHLKKGSFSPELFELSVDNGVIDRIDILEDDANRYVKIIDYKSGSTKFSPIEAVSGLKIQLLFYMDSILKKERSMHKDKRVEPAAVFYFNIQDPLLDYDVKLMDEAVYDNELLKKFAMTGFVNSREEVFRGLDNDAIENGKSSVVFGMGSKELNSSMYMNSKSCAASNLNFENFIDVVKDVAEKNKEEILDGKIDMKPYMLGVKTPCKYCKYKSICCFDDKEFDNSYNRLPGNTKENIEKLCESLNKEIKLGEDD